MTYELQAVSGIADIGPMSFGQLLHACKAKMDFDWSQTAAIMALIWNVNKGKNDRVAQRSDFYRPQLHRKRESRKMPVEKLDSLFSAFAKKA